MREVLRALLDLQQVDREIYRVKEELRRLPQERAKRKAEIDGKRGKVNELDGALKLLKTKIKELEDVATAQRQRLRKLENESQQSRQDAASLAAYQHEMRSVKKEIGEAEEEAVKAMEEVDGHEKTRAGLQGEIDAELKVFNEFDANATREIAAAEARLAALREQRKSKGVEKIKPDLLADYQATLDMREGIALAELDGRICQGCFINVPPNVYVRLARGIELVRCPSCDRILFLRD